MALNLEKQLLFYGSYHHNTINIAIHVICIPTILITAFLFGTNTPSLIPLPSNLTLTILPLNLGTLSAILYSVLYILMEPVAGTLLFPLLLGATAYANYLTSTYPSTSNSYALILFITAWIAQFIGHGVFEGRAPALLDNLVQALFLAPFFVWMEVLFWFGYRPELKARLDRAVEREIEKYRSSKVKKGKEMDGKEEGKVK